MTLVNMGSNSQVVTAIFQPREHLLNCWLISSEIVQVNKLVDVTVEKEKSTTNNC